MKPKCEQYWPRSVGKEIEYGDLRVKLTSEKIHEDYLIREMLLVCILFICVIQPPNVSKTAAKTAQCFPFPIHVKREEGEWKADPGQEL